MRRRAISALMALRILREPAIEPAVAGMCRPKRARPPKNQYPRDDHYQELQRAMPATFTTLNIAA